MSENEEEERNSTNPICHFWELNFLVFSARSHDTIHLWIDVCIYVKNVPAILYFAEFPGVHLCIQSNRNDEYLQVKRTAYVANGHSKIS